MIRTRFIRLNPCFNGILKYNFKTFFNGTNDCLNPCFNGILKYLHVVDGRLSEISLNPCFNGILKYYFKKQEPCCHCVLILVLMEY